MTVHFGTRFPDLGPSVLYTWNQGISPELDDLPPVKGMPQGCAWGVFDKDDKKDVMGTLNLLTPEVVKNAVAEVRQSVSISLK